MDCRESGSIRSGSTALSERYPSPLAVAVSANNGKVYVLGTSQLSYYNSNSTTLLGQVALSNTPVSMHRRPDNSEIYVTGNTGVVVVSTADGSTSAISLGATELVAFSPDSRTAFITKYHTETTSDAEVIYVVDTTTHALKKTITLNDQFTADSPGKDIVDLNLTPDGTTLFLTENTGCDPTSFGSTGIDVICATGNLYFVDALGLTQTGEMQFPGAVGAGNYAGGR